LDIKKKDKTLVSHCNNIIIPLTPTERDVIFTVSSQPRRPVKNEMIIEYIQRDPNQYKGLCMCISRLQAKFEKFSHGEKLFRSVRNRGYYLIQHIFVDA